MSVYKDFNNMTAMPIIELNVNNEWEYWTINCSETEMWIQTNYETLILGIDDELHIDSHLETLYDNLVDQLLYYGNNINFEA